MDKTVIVIGSGFGGAVATKRFTKAGYKVSIIEMGERWKKDENDTDHGSMPEQNQDTKFILRCFCDYPYDYMERSMTAKDMPKLVVVTGTGYGGGSLVYSKIHLRAPESAFDYGWPSGYTRSNLDPYYDRLESPRPNGVGIEMNPDTFKYRRSAVFNAGTCAVGLGGAKANMLAQHNCQRCGWCVPMCVFGKKNTMTHTYLADAEATGNLSVYTNCRVQMITKNASGGYDVFYWKTDSVTHNYHQVNSGKVYFQSASYVVIAAGAMESPCILQRSLTDNTYGRPRINSFSGSTDLGQRIDGQADFAVGGYVGKAYQPVETHKGTIMAAHVAGDDFFIEDLHGIPAGPTVKFRSSFFMDDPYRDHGNHAWGLAYKQKFAEWSKALLAMVLVGKSPSGANISVKNNGGVTELSNEAYLPHPESYDKARQIITALDGELAKTPWERDGQAVTAHPTGGCHMGTVVDPHNLEVYNNHNLHVMDSSVIPHTFANPVHTILAVAQKGMDVILNENDPPKW
ncbi:MAG: GMC family oxidoreductase N-terminal domain-containing protein [bacterium]|nr:GMC family oxidoreductase N-terminal domain-containing protein [bacterium]